MGLGSASESLRYLNLPLSFFSEILEESPQCCYATIVVVGCRQVQGLRVEAWGYPSLVELVVPVSIGQRQDGRIFGWWAVKRSGGSVYVYV